MDIILLIMFIGGNLFLFSRESFDNLADNGFAWLSALVAIAIDIYFIYLIAQSILKRRKKQRIIAEDTPIEDVTRKAEATEQQHIIAEDTSIEDVTHKAEATEQQHVIAEDTSIEDVTHKEEAMKQQRVITENSPIEGVTRKAEATQQQHIFVEHGSIEDMTHKVEAIKHKYGVTSLIADKAVRPFIRYKDNLTSIIAGREALPFPIEHEFINEEIVLTVNSYKERMIPIYERYSFTSNEIKKILDCTDCISVNEKYFYLSSNEDRLEQLKEERDSCLSQLSSYKIEILNDNHDLWAETELAFRCLLNNIKCRSDSLTIRTFIPSVNPADLMLFKYQSEPILLSWGQYYFCLFSSVILVFDKFGVFATAIDPSALRVTLKGGTTIETGIVEFIIADKKISFFTISRAVGETFKKAISNYSRRCNIAENTPIEDVTRKAEVKQQQHVTAEDTPIEDVTHKAEVKQQQRVIAENTPIEGLTRNANFIIYKYGIASLNVDKAVRPFIIKHKDRFTSIIAGKEALPFSIDHEFINKEVVLTVNSYKDRMIPIYERCSFISNEIESILACASGISVNEKKCSYLYSNEAKLKQLKEERDSCLSQLSSYKIEILDDNRDLSYDMQLAFRCLLNSIKCQSDSLTIKEFITHDKPSDLMLFKYENKPVILLWGQHYFCLFSNVILVFDKTGVFATAIDPSALRVTVKSMTESVLFTNGTARWNQYTADDSKCISQGTTRSTWLHTCRDGSPDLRYNHNPRLEHRIDTYEYVIVEFIIANKKVSFSASSGAVGDAFEKAFSGYSRRRNKRHNPIPEFLMLVKSLSNEDDAQIDSIIQTCNSRPDANNYFCKIVAS